MERQTGEHPRIGAVDVIPFVPLGDTTMDECIELARAFGARIAARFDLPVYLYAAAASRSRSGQAGRRPARPVRGPQGSRSANHGREPDFGPARIHPVGRRGGRRRSAVPDRLQHQPRLDRHRAGPADRAPGPRVGRRPAPRSRRMGVALDDPALRPGLDEPARLRGDAALAGLGDGPRRGGRRRRRAARIGADRPVPAGRVPGRGRSRRRSRPAPRSRRAAPPRPATSACATSARCRSSSCASKPPSAAKDDPAGHRGRPDRRPPDGPPDPRTRARSRPWPAACEPVRAGRPGGPAATPRPAIRGRRAPIVATWEDRIVAVGPRALVERSLEAAGPAPRPVRPDRRRGRHDHARPDRRSHPPPVRRQPRGRAAPAPGAAPATSRSWRPAAASCRRSRRPGPASAEELLAHGRRWLEEMLSHGVTTIEAKSGYGLDLPTELRLLEIGLRARPGRADRRPADVARRPRRARRVPPPARSGRGVHPPSPRGAAARRRRPGPGAVRRRLLRAGRLQRRPGAPDPAAPPRPSGCARGSMPTSWHRPAAPSWPPRSGALSADHLAAPSPAGIDALAAAAATGTPGGGHPPAGDDLVPDGRPLRPGPDADRARRPGGHRHGLQPGHVARRPTCPWS